MCEIVGECFSVTVTKSDFLPEGGDCDFESFNKHKGNENKLDTGEQIKAWNQIKFYEHVAGPGNTKYGNMEVDQQIIILSL